MTISGYRQQLESLTPEQKHAVGKLMIAIATAEHADSMSDADELWAFARELKGETKL